MSIKDSQNQGPLKVFYFLYSGCPENSDDCILEERHKLSQGNTCSVDRSVIFPVRLFSWFWSVFTHLSKNYDLQADILYARHALKAFRETFVMGTLASIHVKIILLKVNNWSKRRLFRTPRYLEFKNIYYGHLRANSNYCFSFRPRNPINSGLQLCFDLAQLFGGIRFTVLRLQLQMDVM